MVKSSTNLIDCLFLSNLFYLLPIYTLNDTLIYPSINDILQEFTMALSYTINSGSKLLIVSSLLASSVALASQPATNGSQKTKSQNNEPQKKESQKKAKKAPLGSNEVSSDVAEQLFIEMQQKMQQEEIERLTKELASLKPSDKKRKEQISQRLAELKSTISYQYANNSKAKKATPIKNTKAKRKAKPSKPAQKKPTTKPKFAVKVKPLKAKPQFNARLKAIDPVASYKTAQINNATIKRLTNKNHLVIGRQSDVEQAIEPTTKPFVKSTVQSTSKSTVKPAIDKKGELLAVEPASVNVEHEFQPVVVKPKISKLKIKPHKKANAPKTASKSTAKPSTKAPIKTNVKAKQTADKKSKDANKLKVKAKNKVPNKVTNKVKDKVKNKVVANKVANRVKVSKLSVTKPVAKKANDVPKVKQVLKNKAKTANTAKSAEITAQKSSTTNDMPNTMASELYLKALQAFSVGETNTAIRNLRQYVNDYPNEPLIAKAHYWLGESYLQKEPANYAAARFEFIEVIDRYDNHPNNDKQLKSLYRLSQLSKINNYDDDLKLYTQMLQDRYPTAEETQKAMELLD